MRTRRIQHRIVTVTNLGGLAPSGRSGAPEDFLDRQDGYLSQPTNGASSPSLGREEYDAETGALECNSHRLSTDKRHYVKYARNTLSADIVHGVITNNVLPSYLLVVVSSIAADDAARA